MSTTATVSATNCIGTALQAASGIWRWRACGPLTFRDGGFAAALEKAKGHYWAEAFWQTTAVKAGVSTMAGGKDALGEEIKGASRIAYSQRTV